MKKDYHCECGMIIEDTKNGVRSHLNGKAHKDKMKQKEAKEPMKVWFCGFCVLENTTFVVLQAFVKPKDRSESSDIVHKKNNYLFCCLPD